VDPQSDVALEFLAEHRVAVAPQIAVLLGSGRAAERSLSTLRRGGLARSARIFAGRPSTWSITSRGLRSLGSASSPRRPHLAEYEHDLGLGWLWLAARDGAFGELRAVHTEPSLRAHDARAGKEQPAAGIGTGGVGPGGGERRHYPDLLLQTASGRALAVELELTAKSRGRLSAIMLGYASDARIDAVLYLVPGRALGRTIALAARNAGIADRVLVQRIAAGIQGAPQRAGARSRTPTARDGTRGL
jgi:hypothetical protein